MAASGAAVWPAKGRIGLDDEIEFTGAWVLDEHLLAVRDKGGPLICFVILSGG